MDVEDHRLKLYWSRFGGWGVCACGWTSGRGRTAQMQWAEHITEVILQQRQAALKQQE